MGEREHARNAVEGVASGHGLLLVLATGAWAQAPRRGRGRYGVEGGRGDARMAPRYHDSRILLYCQVVLFIYQKYYVN
jgi:hypothetical protein